jgi:hypothetical protein
MGSGTCASDETAPEFFWTKKVTAPDTTASPKNGSFSKSKVEPPSLRFVAPGS